MTNAATATRRIDNGNHTSLLPNARDPARRGGHNRLGARVSFDEMLDKPTEICYDIISGGDAPKCLTSQTVVRGRKSYAKYPVLWGWVVGLA